MVTGGALSLTHLFLGVVGISTHSRCPQNIPSYLNEEGSCPEVGCICQLGAGMGVSPGCVSGKLQSPPCMKHTREGDLLPREGLSISASRLCHGLRVSTGHKAQLPGCDLGAGPHLGSSLCFLLQLRLHRPWKAAHRWAGQAQHATGPRSHSERLHQAAREAWLRARRYFEQANRWLPVSISPLISAEGLPLLHRGSALSALEVLLQGAVSCGWGRHPAGRQRAIFPLVRSPRASVLSVPNLEPKSWLCGSQGSQHTLCSCTARGWGSSGASRAELTSAHIRSSEVCGELHLSPPLAVLHLLNRDATSYTMCWRGPRVHDVEGRCPESAEVLRRLPSSPWLPRDLLQRKGMLLPNPSRNLTSLDAFCMLGGRNKKTHAHKERQRKEKRERERAHINQRFIRR